MLNFQNLLSQMANSSNPFQMIMSALNPQQKQVINQFQSQSNQQQAEIIARKCNELGISKEQLAQIMKSFR